MPRARAALRRLPWLAVVLPVALGACRAASGPPPPAPAPPSAARPAAPGPADTGVPPGWLCDTPTVRAGRPRSILAIYGDDGRIEVGAALRSEVDDAAQGLYGPPNVREAWVDGILEASRAVALVAQNGELTARPDGSWQLASRTYSDRIQDEFGAPPCPATPGSPGLRFAGQQVAGLATAWLAAPDVVVTAGHAVEGRPVTALRFVFDWRRSDARALPSPAAPLAASQVYAGSALLAARGGAGGYDYAVVRLDRRVDPATGILPLRLRRHGRLAMDEPIYLLGCPRGLPVKYAGDATKVFEPVTYPQYGASLDAFRGNSGSPVLCATDHEVVGMLVGGRSDHRRVGSPPCVMDVRHDVGTRGERVLRSIVILRELVRLGLVAP